MAEEWFVRVEGKEYGPVDLETLEEWKSEGRLIPQNEVRNGPDAEWLAAAQFPELFGGAGDQQAHHESLFRRRSFNEIIAESFRIYSRGFPQFFALALLVAIPSLAMKISLAFTSYREGEPVTFTSRVAGAIAIVMLGAVVASWPVFVAGLQFATVDLAAGRAIRLKEILRQAVGMWRRIARLCLFVYGSYVFWTVLPLMAIFALAGTPSIPSLLIALLALGFQVYMASRLFVNFMFWQQSSTIAGLDSVDALRESKELARSRTHEPRLQRPLHRGALIAAIWLLILLAVSLAVEMPLTLVRLQGITTVEQGYAVLQQLMNAPAPDAMTIGTYVLSSLVHAALRPLLGIAFVVLYFDARARS